MCVRQDPTHSFVHLFVGRLFNFQERINMSQFFYHIILCFFPVVTALLARPPHVASKTRNCSPLQSHGGDGSFSEAEPSLPTLNRRTWLSQTLLLTATPVTTTVLASPSWALIKGNPPPSSMKPISDRPKCTNVEECQALAEKAEAVRAAEAAATMTEALVTSTGIRYRDEEVGTGSEAKMGDDVELYFKVLKLGKRSYDGLSGEGTVVFSRGFGLENDETKPGDKTFITTLGGLSNVAALNEAVPGMKEGGLRRFAVLPEKGWRKPGKQCDGGPGGAGTGGDLRTDYLVVPTATMVAEEACFDTFKQPFPTTFAQQRRMAQRFDQSLIIEVQLVRARPGQ